MRRSFSRDTDVLIVGAGPTGLVLALWLTRLGMRIRIIDKAADAGTTSRAVGVQARTLELYQQLGLAEAVVGHGRQATAANLWVAGRQVARAMFGDIGRGLSPFPYVLIYPQDEHERMLIDQLRQAGVYVERCTELITFVELGGRIRAWLRHGDDSPELCDAAFIAGCDGAHSTVRETLNVAFTGGTYDHLFYVADVEARGAAINGEVQVALDGTDFLAMFPLAQPGRVRLIGAVLDQNASRHDQLAWGDVSRSVIEWLRVDVTAVHWFSTYRVHHRVAQQFRVGAAFLLGDAAHVHSPVGGQGMNTGIGDAVNLAWKIAAVARGRAPAALLDSYEPERIAFARRLVATTDRAFTGVTNRGWLARHVRVDLLPPVIHGFFARPHLRRMLFRMISQTSVTYRGSSLSHGRAGRVRGGDRLPWVTPGADGSGDNYAPLASLSWQVHVYGDIAPDLLAECRERRLAVHVFAWRDEMRRAGIQRHAAYLVRPDGYVALAAPRDCAAAIAGYCEERRLVPRLERASRRDRQTAIRAEPSPAP